MATSNPIIGTEPYAHEVPQQRLHVVRISDNMQGSSRDVSVWRQDERMFCFVDHIKDSIGYARRCLLVRGPAADLYGQSMRTDLDRMCVPYGVDLSTTDGMMLVGLDDENADDVLTMLADHHAGVLWDSDADSVKSTTELWRATSLDDNLYKVVDLLEHEVRVFIVRLHGADAVIQSGNHYVGNDVRAARIRLVAKRAQRSGSGQAIYECLGNEDVPQA